jgi:exosortase/archaeosortase family protein
VLLAVPLAMLGNIVRVANLMFFADAWGVETAFKLYHDYSGVVIFLLVLLLMKPLTRILQCTAVRSDIF